VFTKPPLAAASPPEPQPPAPPAPPPLAKPTLTRYEHRAWPLHETEVDAHLAARSREGWELVSAVRVDHLGETYHFRLLWKRPVVVRARRAA
jgi:hypothetical protein